MGFGFSSVSQSITPVPPPVVSASQGLSIDTGTGDVILGANASSNPNPTSFNTTNDVDLFSQTNFLRFINSGDGTTANIRFGTAIIIMDGDSAIGGFPAIFEMRDNMAGAVPLITARPGGGATYWQTSWGGGGAFFSYFDTGDLRLNNGSPVVDNGNLFQVDGSVFVGIDVNCQNDLNAGNGVNAVADISTSAGNFVTGGTGTITTGDPGSGIAALQFGKAIAAAAVLDAANYWEVKINGVLRKVAFVV